jgi:hypothetical protein
LAEFIENQEQISRQQHDQIQKDILKERVENAVAKGKIPEAQAESIKTVDQFNAALFQVRVQKELKSDQITSKQAANITNFEQLSEAKAAYKKSKEQVQEMKKVN